MLSWVVILSIVSFFLLIWVILSHSCLLDNWKYVEEVDQIGEKTLRHLTRLGFTNDRKFSMYTDGLRYFNSVEDKKLQDTDLVNRYNNGKKLLKRIKK